MANPAVTYTFVNGNVADASQVNQNFTDLINSLTDGSKSLNIDAITAAGAATFNGNSIIGNASGDTSTVNATMSFSTTPKADAISEKTAAAGVTIDGLTIKDSSIVGRTDGVSPTAGTIGEEVSTTTSTGISVGDYRTVATLTLTAGCWLVSATSHPGTASGQTSSESRLNIKGSVGATLGDTVFYAIVDGTAQWCSSICFPTRIVNIASGDANKTVVVQVQPRGANSTAVGTVRATRIA